MDTALAFGKVLRTMRQDAGLTQEQLGLEADLRRTYVSILELGQQQGALEFLFNHAAKWCPEAYLPAQPPLPAMNCGYGRPR